MLVIMIIYYWVIYVKKIELLSPAGNMDCLKAAIEAGCDAVYLGGKLFGARSFAGNFTNDEILQAIKYSHLYGVRVYVTINTIIYEREVNSFINYVRFLHKNNVDAVIIQDLGMLDLLRKKFPNLEIHASTQMHIHNYEGALFAKKMGVKRIVMARETSIDVIKKIKRNLDIEVEVFAHGALCVSYSGQCLMSALIGGRSGNRGTCAQVCRKMYSLYDQNGDKLSSEKYLLSTKDLCTIENVDKLITAGVDSLKIEGRMKRPEYVYVVTKVYRKVIDNYLETGILKVLDEDILELKKIFNRDFTKGFIFDEKNNDFVNQKRPNHQGIMVGKVIKYKSGNLFIKLNEEINAHDGLRIEDEKEDKGLVIEKMFMGKNEVKKAKAGDVIKIKYDKLVKANSNVLLTTDSSQINKIDTALKTKKRKVLIDMKLVAKENKKMIIKVSDGLNDVVLTSNFVVQKAINNPTCKNVIENQITKTGNTVYKVKSLYLDVDSNVFINIKDINELRRKALLLLDEKRLYKIPFSEKEYDITVPSFNQIKKECILLNTKEDYEKYKNGDVIYTTNSELKSYKNVFLKLPRVMNKYPLINDLVLVGEVGSLIKYNVFETDFSFNVVNSYTLAFLHSIGAKKVTLSYELNVTQIKLIIDNYVKRYKKNPNCEVIIDSYPEVMVSKFNLNKMYDVNISYLKDTYGNRYKVISNDDFMTIYNYKKIIYKNKNELYEAGVNYLRINL